MEPTIRQLKPENDLKKDVDEFKRQLLGHLKHTVGRNQITTTNRDWYHALAYVIRDRLAEAWLDSIAATYGQDAKRVYYLSMEFLIGRFKQVIGPRLRFQTAEAQATEIAIAVEVLNRRLDRGRRAGSGDGL